MNLEDAAYYVGISPSSLLAESEKGNAPQPYKITRRRKIWVREDLDEYIDQIAGKMRLPENNSDEWIERARGKTRNKTTLPLCP